MEIEVLLKMAQKQIESPLFKTEIEKKSVLSMFSRRIFIIEENWIVWVECINKFVIIPSPFTFDGASVPRIFWSFISPTGITFLASILHDWGYRYGKFLVSDDLKTWYRYDVDKYTVDTVLKEFPTQITDTKIPGNIAYFGVLVGGYLTWRSYRKKDLHIHLDYPELDKKIILRGNYEF